MRTRAKKPSSFCPLPYVCTGAGKDRERKVHSVALTVEEVRESLRTVEDPELRQSIVDLDMVKDIEVEEDTVRVVIALTVPNCPLQGVISERAKEAILAAGAKKVYVRLTAMTEAERQALAAKLQASKGLVTLTPDRPPGSEKTVYLTVSSGKGGVGKSTVTANLAYALARSGLKVGLIDADIYGFSIPEILGIRRQPTVLEKLIVPLYSFGMSVISMGFFVPHNTPVIWRGPMLGKMLDTFFKEVHWDEDLDVLLFDLPPGTGDVPLDISRRVSWAMDILVTTPHPTATRVAARAGAMTLRLNRSILGIVENMSYVECPDGTRVYPFGEGGGRDLAAHFRTELLAQIPLAGDSPGVEDPVTGETAPGLFPADHPVGKVYASLAEKVMEKLGLEPCPEAVC